MLFIYSKKSFTLAEVLVSIVILGIMSTAAYLSFSSLSDVETSSRDRFTAMNVLTSSFEEIRAHAHNVEDFFDDLNPTNYPPGSWIPLNIADYSAAFFEREITAQDEGSTDFKRMNITVRWTNRRGNQEQISNVFFLSRPPEPLPGNIHGTVTDRVTGAPIVAIRVEIMEFPYARATDSDGAYTFVDAGSNYQLRPGNYRLRIQETAGYWGYETPVGEEIIVSPGGSTEVNIALDPKPLPGTITGRIVDTSGNPIPGIRVYLRRDWQGGPNRIDYGRRDTNANGEFTFTNIVSRQEDGTPFKYTVATYRAYTQGYCGIIPNLDPGWNKSYHYDGWSSSRARANGAEIGFLNPWWGDADTDRIEVPPGGTTNITTLDGSNIILRPVPLATISGIVRYQGQGIEGADVEVRWHSWQWWGSTTTDNYGNYSITVPAAQELFPNSNYYRLRLRAARSGEPPDGCGYRTDYRRPPPLYEGETEVVNFNLGTIYCGNVSGLITNGFTGAGVSQIRVRVGGRTGLSDGSGNYCVPDGGCGDNPVYTVPIGSHSLDASRNGYYQYITEGNTWYARVGNGHPVNVEQNQTTTYNFEIFPRGYGTVTGRVVDAATTDHISNATVVLDPYTGSDVSDATGNDGVFTINCIETWPPPPHILPPDDLYYRYSSQPHDITISAGDEYEEYNQSGIDVERDQTTDLENIPLIKKGQM